MSSTGPKHYNAFFSFWGVLPPTGPKAAKMELWNGLTTPCALLTSISGSGMFYSANYVKDFTEDGNEAGLAIAELTMMFFCASTFTFLGSTVSAVFFANFARRDEAVVTASDAHMVLGSIYHMPQVFFRVGLLFMICSFSLFFILVMSRVKMIGCLIFCITCFIVPMVAAMVRSASVSIGDKVWKKTAVRA